MRRFYHPLHRAFAYYLGMAATKTHPQHRHQPPSAPRRARSVIALSCLMVSLMMPATASNPHNLPSLGDGSSSIVSPQMEAQIGSVFLKQINAALPMADDVLIQYYVEQHIRNLAQYSDMRQPLQAVVVVDECESKHKNSAHWTDLRKTLVGANAPPAKKCTDVEHQIRALLDLATNPELLAVAWSGWRPWL